MRKLVYLVILLSIILIMPYVLGQFVPGCCATNICQDGFSQPDCTGAGGIFYSNKFCTDVPDCGCCICNPDTSPTVLLDNIYSNSGCQQRCAGLGAANSIIFSGKTIQDCQGIGIRTVTGTVKDELGNPLYQATITASPSGRGTNTNQQGQYTLTLVNTGDTLTVQYLGSSATGTIGAANIYDFTLTLGIAKATLAGHVEDAAGNNLAGASIVMGIYQTQTNANGDFTLSNIDPGTYTLTALKPGYQTYTETISFTGAETKTRNIVLIAGAAVLSGKVIDQDNTPMQGVSVAVQGYPGLYTSTASDGRYSIQNVPFGTLSVTATPSPLAPYYLPQTKTISFSAANNILNFTLTYVGPCTDGTARNTCSKTRPRFCNAGGSLLDNYCYGPNQLAGDIDDCGCASGYRCQVDGSCKKIQSVDCCKYEFQCITPLAPGDTDCAEGLIGCAQQCLPVQNCPENTALSSSTLNWPVCYCGKDIVINENQGKYCCDLASSPYISDIPCPASNYSFVKGKVIDKTNKLPLRAFITVNNQETYLSETQEGLGFFSISVRPNQDYNFRFSKPPYYKLAEKTITSPDREKVKDIGMVELERESYPCAYPQAEPVPGFKAEHVKCKPYVKLSWETGYCPNTEGFILTRLNDGMQWTFPSSVGEFTDKGPDGKGLEWSREYGYAISAVYIDISERASEAKTAVLKLGDANCENRCDNKEFCMDEYSRRYCDNNNILYSATTARGDPSDCSDLEYTGNKWFCSGPNNLGNTWCQENGECGYNLDIPFFGLFFDENNCYWDLNGNLQACYLDRSSTSVDFCFQCPPHYSDEADCYLYQSEPACTSNRCGFENCDWEKGFFEQTGEGICYDTEHISDIKYNLKDRNLVSYCGLCSKDAQLFHNYGCDQEKCSKLGFCYSTPENNGNCNYCSDTSKCSDFKTEEACIGATGRNQNFRLNTAAVPLTAEYSDDACGLGRCYWDGTECFKDGDSNRVKDCATEFCRIDNEPPITSLSTGAEVLDVEGDELVFNVSEQISALYFCLYAKGSTPCTKFYSKSPEPGKKNVSVNPLAYFSDVLTREGGYILRYFSKDSNQNIELIKESVVFIDPFAPDISVEFFTECLNCDAPVYPKESRVRFAILADEIVSCTDEFIVDDKIYTSTYSGDTTYEKTYPASGGIDDGTYTYKLNCRDSVGNTANITKLVKVDSYLMISQVKPLGAIKETDVTYEARTSEVSDCSISIDGLGFVQMNSVNRQNHFLNRSYQNNTYHVFIINCDEISSDRVDSFAGAFAIDNLAPVTSVYINGDLLEAPGLTWQSFEDNNSFVRLECNDAEIQEKPLNFGCARTRYCISTFGACIPNLALQPEQDIPVNENSWICYYSEDAGNNREQKHCGYVYVDADIQMSSLFNITLVNPKYEVSHKQLTDFSIKTNKPGACSWAKNFLASSYEAMTPFGASTSDFLTHTERNFIIDEIYPSTQLVWVWCRPSVEETLPEARTVYFLSYDTTPPKIVSIAASPETVKEYPLKTKITAVTDDETRCRYGPDLKDYDSGTDFPGADAFSTTHEAEIGGLIDGESYTYDVICQNKAGNMSAKDSVSFSVDLSLPAEINIITPKDGAAYNTTALPLDVRTDKRAQCVYSQNSNFPTTATYALSFDSDLRHHYSAEFNFSTGSHTLYVKCTFQTGPAKTAKTTFIVDLTPPVNVTINDSAFSCSTDNLAVTWDAEDSESGIAEFYYFIQKKADPFDEESIEWYITKQKSPDKVPDLNTTTLYVAIVKAKNKAGLFSEPVISDGFTIDPTRPECSETDAPEARIEKKQVYGGVKVTLICEDESGCNDALDSYGIAESQSLCAATNLYEAPVLVTNTSWFCWAVEDLAGNTGRGSELVTVRPTACEDDVDCDGIEDCRDPDIDGDGLMNWEDDDDDLDEIPDEQDPDDDNDGIADSQDIDCDNDLDNDGLHNGIDDDDDGDGINDCEDEDDDNDGLLDGPDEDDDNDGVPDVLDPDHGGTTAPDNDNDLDNDGIPNPVDNDIDGDGILNDVDPDDDNDGVPDCVDQDDDNDGIDDYRDPDNSNDWDQDGMPNDWEQQHGLDPLRNDADEDADNDGLTNLEEYQQGTSPNDKDTDKDGWDDFTEYQKAFDPLDPESHPPSYLWLWVLIILLVLVATGGGYYFYVYYSARKEAEAPKAPVAPKPAVPARPAAPAPIVREVPSRIGELRREKRRAERAKLFEKFGKPRAELKKIPSAEERPAKKPAKNEDIFAHVEKLAKKEGALDKLEEITKKVKSKDEMERLVELSKKIKKPMSEIDKLMEVVKKSKGKKK